MPRINQDELARALNLSRTTVSRSLSNHPAISAITRRKVQALARKLGYRAAPIRAVRRARTAKPISFGVLLGHPLAPADSLTLPRILEGITRRARIEHATIEVVRLDTLTLPAATCRRDIFRHIRTGGWRGAILLYPFPTEVAAAIAKKLSVVSILTDYHDLRIDLIDTDHAQVRLHVDWLVAHHHQRIGFIHWHYPVGGLWGRQRFAAFAASLYAHGLPLKPSWTANIHANGPAPLTREALAIHAAKLIQKSGVTALVCAADHQAYALIEDLATLGLHTPRDYSITGFDGNQPPDELPALATLQVPNEDLGASAVAHLISRLLAPTAPLRKTFVEAAWHLGQTLGAA